jgi:hypothetical protein
LILLETYSTKSGKELTDSIPPFLEHEKETTGDPSYSMFNLSLKAEWSPHNFEKKKVNCVRNFFTCEQNEAIAAAEALALIKESNGESKAESSVINGSA